MTIAIDFDGVIHQYSRGWQDGTIYDPPMPGALEGLRALMDHDAVFIFTAREPEQVMPWLEQHGFDVTIDERCGQCLGEGGGQELDADLRPASPAWECDACKGSGLLTFWNARGQLLVTNRKLAAVAYLDDRAVRFTDWEQALTALGATPRLLDCGLCYEEWGEEVHPHPECPVGREPVPVGRDALRDRIAGALAEHGMVQLCDQVQVAEYECCADAVVAVLPPPADRVAVEERLGEQLDEAGATIAQQTAALAQADERVEFYEAAHARMRDRLEVARVRVQKLHAPGANGECQHCHRSAPCPTVQALDGPDEELRRMAVEAQQQTPTTADQAAALGLTPTEYRAHSHRAAADAIRAAVPGLYATVGLRVEDALADQPAVVAAVAGEEPDTETEAHPPTHTWKVESPRRDQWASWGATHDERVWAVASYEDAIEHASGRPFRLVRATTTYTVEAGHTPAASQPGKEA